MLHKTMVNLNGKIMFLFYYDDIFKLYHYNLKDLLTLFFFWVEGITIFSSFYKYFTQLLPIKCFTHNDSIFFFVQYRLQKNKIKQKVIHNVLGKVSFSWSITNCVTIPGK